MRTKIDVIRPSELLTTAATVTAVHDCNRLCFDRRHDCVFSYKNRLNPFRTVRWRSILLADTNRSCANYFASHAVSTYLLEKKNKGTLSRLYRHIKLIWHNIVRNSTVKSVINYNTYMYKVVSSIALYILLLILIIFFVVC